LEVAALPDPIEPGNGFNYFLIDVKPVLSTTDGLLLPKEFNPKCASEVLP
jgi:hypothetical protein